MEEVIPDGTSIDGEWVSLFWAGGRGNKPFPPNPTEDAGKRDQTGVERRLRFDPGPLTGGTRARSVDASVASARELWNPRLKQAQCLWPTCRRKEATVGEATMTWKTPSAAAEGERASPAPQKKKERIFPIVSSVKHDEEKEWIPRSHRTQQGEWERKRGRRRSARRCSAGRPHLERRVRRCCFSIWRRRQPVTGNLLWSSSQGARWQVEGQGLRWVGKGR
jgi:hypothetical protein